MTRKTISRAIPKEWKETIDDHALITGQIVWASNYLHTYLHLVFVGLMSNAEIARALWHQQGNDSPQRNLLIAALVADQAMLPSDKKRFLWAAKKAVKLAELRNDLVHLPIVPVARIYKISNKTRLDLVQVVSDKDVVNVPPARLERVLREDWIKSLPILRGDILALANYVRLLWLGYFHEHILSPLPHRPQLRLLPEQRVKKSPKSRESQRRP